MRGERVKEEIESRRIQRRFGRGRESERSERVK